jgi:hypothetical protein
MPDVKPLSQEAGPKGDRDAKPRRRRFTKIAFRIARTLKTMVAITAIIPITGGMEPTTPEPVPRKIWNRPRDNPASLNKILVTAD